MDLGSEKVIKIEQFRTAYRLLNIPPAADIFTIKSHYRDLARTFHPDRHFSDSAARQKAEEMMKQINHAFCLIKDAPLQNPEYSIQIDPKTEHQTISSTQAHTAPKRSKSFLIREQPWILFLRFILGVMVGGLLLSLFRATNLLPPPDSIIFIWITLVLSGTLSVFFQQRTFKWLVRVLGK